MKQIFKKSLRLFCPVLMLVVCAAGAASGQDARLRISDLDKLEARASQVIDVSIDERLLRVAMRFLNAKDPEQAKIRELVAGLKGVYVKSYEFDSPDQYTVADVASINEQLKAPGWSRMVGIRSTREKQNIEVYTMLVGERIGGIAVVAAEPKQLTVVNIVGPIDLEKLAELEGNFGIPKLQIKRDGQTPKE